MNDCVDTFFLSNKLCSSFLMAIIEDQKWLERYGNKGVVLRHKIAELARPAVLRFPPFDSLQLESCLEPYRRYLNQKTHERQNLLIDAFIKQMEFLIGGEVCRDKEAIDIWSEIGSEYQRDYARSYVPPPPLQRPEIKNSEIKKLIVEQFKQEWPEFERNKSIDSNVLCMSKPNAYVDKVIIEFDLGTFGAGHFSSVKIGTVLPKFTVELSTILCIKKSRWNFHNAERCIEVIAEIIRLTKLLMPMFEDKISESIGSD